MRSKPKNRCDDEQSEEERNDASARDWARADALSLLIGAARRELRPHWRRCRACRPPLTIASVALMCGSRALL
ncbi:unnamed protein product [Plutella xylostella]|uniref:(diamondback moth) hypothetical protein n=1 Tax=Plutella xylostella TaxID=51655 RepID=A0A8S4ENY8_PLUXY|nr:unnamed protein product [Plutella xylostella]